MIRSFQLSFRSFIVRPRTKKQNTTRHKRHHRHQQQPRFFPFGNTSVLSSCLSFHPFLLAFLWLQIYTQINWEKAGLSEQCSECLSSFFVSMGKGMREELHTDWKKWERPRVSENRNSQVRRTDRLLCSPERKRNRKSTFSLHLLFLILPTIRWPTEGVGESKFVSHARRDAEVGCGEWGHIFDLCSTLPVY